MAEDLVESEVLIGKDKNQVEMLLGDASNMMENDSLNMYYTLWNDYGSDIDPIKSYGLHIGFNEKGQVKSAEVQKWK